jgi:hypothetical protein
MSSEGFSYVSDRILELQFLLGHISDAEGKTGGGPKVNDPLILPSSGLMFSV